MVLGRLFSEGRVIVDGSDIWVTITGLILPDIAVIIVVDVCEVEAGLSKSAVFHSFQDLLHIVREF